MIIYNFIKHLILHLKYTKILKKVYKDENLLNNLSNLFNSQFKLDWVGRIYTVVNPNLSEGEYSPNTQIYEYTENGLENNHYIKSYIMDHLNIAKQFIKANNLFDLLTYEIKKIDDYDNYLFIIQPITWYECKKYAKLFALVYGCIIILIGISIYLYI